MKRKIQQSISSTLSTIGMIALLTLPLTAHSATVALANSPLASTTTTPVKPNVFFILDDSGSMDWNYLPDWANDNNPLPAPNTGSGSSYTNTTLFHRNSDFNGVAYNPATTYLKPIFFNADGTLNTTTYPDQLSPWTAVKDDGYGVQFTTTSNLVGNASYYIWEFAEYCSTLRMTSCVTSSAPVTIGGIFYDVPARLRWCNSAGLNNCQSINNATYKYPRYPGAVIAAIGAKATFTITSGQVISQIVVNGKRIMSGATTGNNNTGTVATRTATKINDCTAAAISNCQIAGYSASVSGNVVTITAPASLGAVTYTPTVTYSSGATGSITNFGGYTAATTVPGNTYYTNIVSTTTSYPYPGKTTKASTRSDCAGTTCTYTEEMNNYANWWAYYHTRMQSMKTSVSRAFKNINKNFRLGFTTISDKGATNGNTFLGNDTFELTHKNSWFKKLFAANPIISTPLRGALSKAGRYYAKKITGQVDPVLYSCQQNFTILSTDGYWNAGYESPNTVSGDACENTTASSSNYGAYGFDNKTCVGNLDAIATTVRPMREGTTAVSSSLADVAKYYYDNDLRTTALGNCAGGISTDYPSGNPDVCTNNVFVSPADNNTKQHMTTFTMGLGIDGTLVYQSDYDAATSGDFYNLKKGLGTPTANWPDPISNTQGERIDDLWHAAVNGRGYYFSAGQPDEIINGLTRTLTAITAKLGAAAAAATSTLNPVPGNNFSYVASYTTVSWTGNLESRSVNTATGQVSKTANWCVENVTASTCVAPNTVVTDTSGSSTVYNCVTPNATLATCPAPGVFDSVALTCSNQIANACTGSLPTRVTPYSDTRTILTANDTADSLINFDDAFATTHPGYFNAARISSINQWGTMTAAQRTTAEGINLIRYLRGQNGFEDRLSNPATDRLYRAREAVMGDALESQPAFVGKPLFPYVYPGYPEFRTANTYRQTQGIVYMGTNDGMVHAFNANTGEEKWAYVPSTVIPNMWRLADNVYSTNHMNYVNGSVNTSDICISNCTAGAAAVWKTILVGGLNGGGRGYYALDVTDHTQPPSLLWEFTTTAGISKYPDDDLGYSFGNPVVTRTAAGKWVVLVTSGYNNISPGTGKGYLYVLDAYTGQILSKISTGVGSTTTPSGLAKIAAWNNEPGGNQTSYVYAGDLQGNVWRFDINSTLGADIGNGSVMKFATLFEDVAGTSPQPITTSPILGEIGGKRVIFVGTGKYLEASDLSTTQVQSLYGIKDDEAITTFVNPRNPAHTGTDRMIPRALINNPDGTATRVLNPDPAYSANIDFSVDRGWYLDFPDKSMDNNAAERQQIEGKLLQGVLIIPTIVPSSTVCRPGGYGWLNYIKYDTGLPLESSMYDSPIVGVNVIYIGGKPKILVVTAADPTPEVHQGGDFPSGSAGFTGQRVIWREVF